MSSWLSWSAGTRATASCQVMSFSFTISHGDADGGDAGALAVAGLEHEQLAVFHRELEVLHLAEMLFQRGADVLQLLVGLGHLLLQRRDGVGRAHAGDDILALRVDQVLAVEHLLARGGIARERDAGAAFVAGVAEDHRLHVDGGAPLVRDVVLLAIDDGALVVPRAEHGADRAAQLLVRVARELAAGAVADQLLEADDQFLAARRRRARCRRHPCGRGTLSFFRPVITTSNGS